MGTAWGCRKGAQKAFFLPLVIIFQRDERRSSLAAGPLSTAAERLRGNLELLGGRLCVLQDRLLHSRFSQSLLLWEHHVSSITPAELHRCTPQARQTRRLNPHRHTLCNSHQHLHFPAAAPTQHPPTPKCERLHHEDLFAAPLINIQ